LQGAALAKEATSDACCCLLSGCLECAPSACAGQATSCTCTPDDGQVEAQQFFLAPTFQAINLVEETILACFAPPHATDFKPIPSTPRYSKVRLYIRHRSILC
jgi:hypothetical protein